MAVHSSIRILRKTRCSTNAGLTWSLVQLGELASQRSGVRQRTVRRKRACHSHLSIQRPAFRLSQTLETRCSTCSRSVSPLAMQPESTLGTTDFLRSPFNFDPAPEPSVRRALLLEPRFKVGAVLQLWSAHRNGRGSA